jgi:multiple sugar transport system substrate-binding protein
MMYLSSLIYVWEEQLKAVNWDIVSLPTVKPGIGSQSYPSYFGITKMAKHKDAAMEVLKFMVSDEFQSNLARKGIMPVLNKEQIKQEFGKESPYRDRNMKAVFYNDFAPIPERTPYDAKIINTYSSIFTQANTGKLDINSALLQAEEQANMAIEEYKKNQ